jgi:hypothetical protein
VKDGLELPIKYFNSTGNFPFSPRPEFDSPKSLVNHKTHAEYNQKQLARIIVSGTVCIANYYSIEIIITEY